jgi:hypothetical protein
MEQILAYVFDLLKAKSPTIAAGLLLVLGTAHAFFSNPTSVELLGQTATTIGYWVSLVWLALQGSRTTMLLAGGATEKKK